MIPAVRARARRFGRLGQIVVEMLLILPVFLTIVFTIMELGHMAFWVIVLNHATYEVARLGALTAGPYPGPSSTGVNDSRALGLMRNKMREIIPAANVQAIKEPTLMDQQARQQNYDLVVTGSYNMRLVFPISSILLSSPRGTGRRLIAATIRMPIEQPLHQ